MTVTLLCTYGRCRRAATHRVIASGPDGSTRSVVCERHIESARAKEERLVGGSSSAEPLPDGMQPQPRHVEPEEQLRLNI